MGLEIRKRKDGTLIQHWYGAYRDHTGRRVIESLSEPLPRNMPASLLEKGDPDFEASRARALKELEGFKAEARTKGRADHLTERLIESKTGRKLEYVKLAELPAKWRGLGRKVKPTAEWLSWCDTVFSRFAEAVPCEYLHEVTPEQATAYVETLRAGFTNRTAGGAASLLKSAFARLLPLGTSNPFDGEIKRRGTETGGDTIHRQPLTAPELVKLFETARPDPFLYPLTICAALTGMRIGDVCNLKWQSVDLRAGVVAVKTSKTGKGVEIPIFEPLRKEFEAALADKGESPYVWPDAARMYKANRYGITYRGKSLFARAFAGNVQTGQEAAALMPERADLTEVFPEARKAVQSSFEGAKRDRILDTLKRYARGQSYRDIEAETGRQRGQVSEDLHDAERVSGLTLRRGLTGRKGTTLKSGRDIKTLIAATRQKRWEGKTRPQDEKRLSASLLGWHALRGTWATLALSAGIPVETVKLVTGHGTANTVLKFYYNPQREHLRAVLGDKLPDVLTGRKGEKTALTEADPVATMAAQLQSMNKADRARLAKLLNVKGGK